MDGQEIFEKEPPGNKPSETDVKTAPRLLEEPLEMILEALLFVSTGPVTASRLAQAAGKDESQVRAALSRLAASYSETQRAFEIIEIAKGFQLLTKPVFHEMIRNFKKTKKLDRLSSSALETLSIIAYKQPIIRAEIEAIRGVQSGNMIRNLLEKRLIRVAGRDKRPGNPMLYRTTAYFLEHFGLQSLKALPSVEELKTPSP